jgi:SAM-dependent methyltransferase
MDAPGPSGNVQRFSGFADLYDASRPAPPSALGTLIASYAQTRQPTVVDLGSGTGLSARWAATWAGAVTGIEPNDDMRARAEARPTPGVHFVMATAQNTQLPAQGSDVVLAVQAMHWMEPRSTLEEVARILRPGGVFAVIDADWPPVSGLARAESAWLGLERRIQVFEARASRGELGDELGRPVVDDELAATDGDLVDPHRNRAMPGGARSWSKSQHLDRMVASGAFGFTREVVFDGPIAGGVERFIALMRSQGSYQALRRLGLSDDTLGMSAFEREVGEAFARAVTAPALSFSWRARLGVRSSASPEGQGSSSA